MTEKTEHVQLISHPQSLELRLQVDEHQTSYTLKKRTHAQSSHAGEDRSLVAKSERRLHRHPTSGRGAATRVSFFHAPRTP